MKKIFFIVVFGFVFVPWLNAQTPLSSKNDTLLYGRHGKLSLNLNSFKKGDLGKELLKTFEPKNQTATTGHQPTLNYSMPIHRPKGHFPMLNYPIDSTQNYSLKIYEPE